MRKIHPFNFKALMGYLILILTIGLCIFLCIKNFRKDNILLGLLFISIITFLIFVLIVNLFQSIEFKEETLFFPKGFTNVNNPSEATNISYSNIKEVKFIAKKDNGPHIKRIFGNKNTILLKLQSGKELLIDATFLSRKQVDDILNEINNHIKN